MDDINNKIKELESKILNLKVEVGVIDSRIDTLSCYRGTEHELEELYEQSNNLEDEISKLQKELNELQQKKQTSTRR